MNLFTRLPVCMALLMAAALPAAAQGVLLIEKETRNGKSTTNRIQLDKNYMRAETTTSDEQSAFVLDGPKQVMRSINLTKKTYTEISKAELDQIGGQMAGMMAQMEAQLRGLPPEQRKMMEQMMQSRGMAAGMGAATKTEYRAAGTDKAGQWACAKYEGYVGQQKTVEVCTVEPKALGLVPADFEIANQMVEFIRGLAPEAAEGMYGTAASQGYPGIAVKRTTFRNNTVESVKELTEVRRESFPASTFEVPAGFRREAMPGARR